MSQPTSMTSNFLNKTAANVGVEVQTVAEASLTISVIFGLCAFISFVILVVAAVKMDARASAGLLSDSTKAYAALSVLFAAFFLMPVPIVNIGLAIAAIVYVNRIKM